MPNKNDMSDLAEFALVSAVIFCGLIAIFAFGYARAEEKFGPVIRAEIKTMDAKLSNYMAKTGDKLKI